MNPFDSASEKYREVFQAALDMKEVAYCKYSKFQVGAALLGTNGQIYTGCNVEIASYGLTNCAERTAIFKAVSEKQRTFQMIAISGSAGDELVTPCGACRQVLFEFAPDLEVFLLDSHGNYKKILLKELLPYAFDSSVLPNK